MAGSRVSGGRSRAPEARWASSVPPNDRQPARQRPRAARGGRRRSLRVVKPGRIRTLGPLVACIPPLLLGAAAALVWLGWSCTSVGCVKPSLLSYGLLLLAVPTALFTGLPWLIGPLNIGGALATSALLWLVLGRWAAGRVTADVDATWRDFWVEFGVMAAAVWLGIAGGFAVITTWMSI